jgi:hypothetical protein
LNEEEKEIITEEIKKVREELKKSELSYSHVKKSMDRLKERDPEFYGRLLVILKDPTVAHFLNIAARKELGI